MNRVIHHKIAYSQPAPFRFKILNKSLQTIEGKNYKIEVTTQGDIVPENIKIKFNNESYYLNKKDQRDFIFEFEYPVQNIEFYFEANNIVSGNYILEVYATPKITDFDMNLNFPDYTKLPSEIIKNTGNASIPQGTEVTWQISAQNTELLNFIVLENKKDEGLKATTKELTENQVNDFNISKQIFKNFKYKINTSNKNIKDFEELNYELEVIKDEYPRILVKSDIDSVQRGPVQFIGQLSDDYGISKLQVIAKNIKTNAIPRILK